MKRRRAERQRLADCRSRQNSCDRIRGEPPAGHRIVDALARRRRDHARGVACQNARHDRCCPTCGSGCSGIGAPSRRDGLHAVEMCGSARARRLLRAARSPSACCRSRRSPCRRAGKPSRRSPAIACRCSGSRSACRRNPRSRGGADDLVIGEDERHCPVVPAISTPARLRDTAPSKPPITARARTARSDPPRSSRPVVARRPCRRRRRVDRRLKVPSCAALGACKPPLRVRAATRRTSRRGPPSRQNRPRSACRRTGRLFGDTIRVALFDARHEQMGGNGELGGSARGGIAPPHGLMRPARSSSSDANARARARSHVRRQRRRDHRRPRRRRIALPFSPPQDPSGAMREGARRGHRLCFRGAVR